MSVLGTMLLVLDSRAFAYRPGKIGKVVVVSAHTQLIVLLF